MIPKTLKNNRGMALLISITVITLLVTVTIEFHRRMRATVIATASTRDRLTLTHMASAGIHAGMALLIKDKTESDIDTLREDWANPEKINHVLQDIPFETGTIDLKINDELSKIQVNALVSYPESRKFNEVQRALWERFLELFINPDIDSDDSKPTPIINAIKDWLDFGDDEAVTGLSGAESAYYQLLENPYPARNGPIRYSGELARIKGITPDLFHVGGEETEISKHITIYGIKDLGGNQFTYSGEININTAELPVITALLPSEAKDLALAIYEFRQETTDLEYIHDISKPTWYKNVPGIGDVEINPKLITTSSNFFRIEATATLNGMKVTVRTVIKREKDENSGRWRCRVLNWQVK